jgi:steroid delta-isomerase-like uncharacterized protein
MSNEQTLRAWLTAQNGWRLDTALPLAHSSLVAHISGGTEISSRDEWQATTEHFASAFPDYFLVVHEIVGDGNHAAARWTWTGIHTGDLMGVAATGCAVSVSGMGFYRFEDDLICEEWIQEDTFGMLQQLGIIPAV